VGLPSYSDEKKWPSRFGISSDPYFLILLFIYFEKGELSPLIYTDAASVRKDDPFPEFLLIPMPRLLGRGTTNHENRVSQVMKPIYVLSSHAALVA
jgi:hypothetical protein